MNETEYAEINRLFHEKFNQRMSETMRAPTTCYISQPTWYALCCYFFRQSPEFRTVKNDPLFNQWNGLPVVRVMDENYFELR